MSSEVGHKKLLALTDLKKFQLKSRVSLALIVTYFSQHSFIYLSILLCLVYNLQLLQLYSLFCISAEINAGQKVGQFH